MSPFARIMRAEGFFNRTGSFNNDRAVGCFIAEQSVDTLNYRYKISYQEDIMSKELAKTYDPKGIEERLYTKWMDNGYFHAKVNPDKKPFTIVMPPPNVTGQLHMGHALDETMQDILIRFKRMQGYEALWQPGTDHAAIATEVKVIDKLKKEGIDKHDLGREEFLKHAWACK